MQLFNTLLLSATILGTPVETTPTTKPTEPEVVEPSVGETTPTDDKVLYEDTNKNGVPDKFEDYWDKNIRNEKYLNIGLASIISVGVSITPTIYHAFSRRKEKKENKAINNELIEQNDLLTKELQEQTAIFNKEMTESADQIKELKLEIAVLTKDLKDATTSLKKYGQFEKKVNCLINCAEAVARDKDFIQQGISKEIRENIEEVR